MMREQKGDFENAKMVQKRYYDQEKSFSIKKAKSNHFLNQFSDQSGNTNKLFFSSNAQEELKAIEKDSAKKDKWNKIQKTLNLIANDPMYPGLNSKKIHKATVLFPSGIKEYFDEIGWVRSDSIMQSYVENHVAGAYRIYWIYGANPKEILILRVTNHL